MIKTLTIIIESMVKTVSKLQVKQLHFSYNEQVEVLTGIDLTLQGESTAIIGQNGAGKTTFVKLLKRLLHPTSGNIYYNGKDLQEYTAANLSKYIGLVFQNPNDQIFKSKVIDEVMFGPLNIGQNESQAMQSAKNALQLVGLESYTDKNPYDLSLAERKMIAIASIIAMDTDVIIFDEPTMGQDYTGKERIKDIIQRLQMKGKLVLCILHDMDFAAEVFERTIIINQGKILLDGHSKEVFAHKDILKQAYLEQPHVMQIANRLGIEGVFLTEQELISEIKNKYTEFTS